MFLENNSKKGHILPENALGQIPIGASQDQVLLVLGTPSTARSPPSTARSSTTFHSEASVRLHSCSSRCTDQRVIAVCFDAQRTAMSEAARQLRHPGRQDLRTFVSRTTASGGQDLSYLTYVFRLIKFERNQTPQYSGSKTPR